MFVFCPIVFIFFLFFFTATATTEIYTLSLHDALPIWLKSAAVAESTSRRSSSCISSRNVLRPVARLVVAWRPVRRSEEHTSELQSRQYLVCRLLLEKKKKHIQRQPDK